MGCVECKMIVAKEIGKALEPFRERRAELAAKPEYIREVLADGADRARLIARETLKEAKQRMGLA
jgi:tryptophanyl-tRNA synthetase